MSGAARENRPLLGKRILVTRPQPGAQKWCDAIRRAGAEPIHLAAIRIEALEAPGLDEHLAGSLDWLVLSSAETVRQLESRYPSARQHRVACVGEVTAEAARGAGFRVTSLAQPSYDARSLAAALQGEGSLESARIVFPCAEGASATLPDSLRRAGAEVARFHVYRNTAVRFDLPGLAAALERCDLLTFASPSAVDSVFSALVEIGREELARGPCLALGQTTAEALRKWGGSADVVPEAPDAESVVAALEAFFAHP